MGGVGFRVWGAGFGVGFKVWEGGLVYVESKPKSGLGFRV